MAEVEEGLVIETGAVQAILQGHFHALQPDPRRATSFQAHGRLRAQLQPLAAGFDHEQRRSATSLGGHYQTAGLHAVQDQALFAAQQVVPALALRAGRQPLGIEEQRRLAHRDRRAWRRLRGDEGR
ncbi:hypothetical protein D3C80_1786720 [compost metagenome]